MSHTTFFVQECPTCGRRLQIRVAYLGKRLYCQHCGGPFFAADPAAKGALNDQAPTRLLERAERLLAFAEQQQVHPPYDTEWSGGELPAY